MRLLSSIFTCLLATSAACAPAQANQPEEGAADLAAFSAGIDVDVHDVAVLFPLPEPGHVNDLWPASREMADGRALLPIDLVSRLGDIVAGDANETTHKSLRLVSLRLEPCFVPRGASANACERQIRFIFQPVVVDPAGVLPSTTLDAAVHVLYTLSSSSFAALVRRVVALRPSLSRSSSPTLGVHPELAREGLSGPFARALERAVLDSTAKGRLTRITFVGVRGRGNEWQFGGLQIEKDGAVGSLPILPDGAHLQSLVLQHGAQTFSKSLSPQSAGKDDVSLLFDSLSAESASLEARSLALQAANRIENPDFRTSENTDCATCHTIASSRLWAEKAFGLREQRGKFEAPGFALESTTARSSDLGVLRALGYVDREPVVSLRAANETAKAAQMIRAGKKN